MFDIIIFILSVLAVLGGACILALIQIGFMKFLSLLSYQTAIAVMTGIMVSVVVCMFAYFITIYRLRYSL